MIRATGILRIAATLTISVAATSCFTGVESTPKITDADVRRETSPATPDETYLAGINPTPVGKWVPGRQFLVTDSKISLAVLPQSFGGTQLNQGDTLRFSALHRAMSVTGAEVSDLEFNGSNGVKYTYRVDRPTDSVSQRPLEIPFTVDLTIVSATGKKLLDKDFFILTSARRDSLGGLKRARKFIPVRITEVSPGTAVNPVRVKVADSFGDTGYLFLNPEARSSRASGSFASVLSLSDPRKRYPAILDEAWENIINNRVRPGMTRDECRLAIGAPVDIIRRPGYGYLYEAWRYENGTYLIFEDGILRK